MRMKNASYSPFFLGLTSLLPKKTLQMKQEPASTVDFHLEMVRKIDELLKEPKPAGAAAATPPIHSLSPPVEERAPIFRHAGHDEVFFGAPAMPLMRPRPIPEEFKEDFPLGMNPTFRFVTSLDSLNDFALPRQNDKRIEIIDISSSQRERPVSILRLPTDAAAPRHTHTDIAFLSAMTNSEDHGTERSQLYYLQGKSLREKKAEKQDRELSYIPDLNDRIQEIKQKEQEEQQRRREEEQRQQAEQQHKREKEEAEQQRQKEKEQRKKQKKTETKKDTQEKKAIFHKKKQETPQSTKEPEAEPEEPTAEPPTGKMTKRQERLAIRQAKIEERKHKQRQKLLLKEQRKKDYAKKTTKNQTTLPASDSKPKFSLFKHQNQRTQTTPEPDDDLVKFLQLTDQLLGQLPEDVIDRFAHSDDFELYEKVMARYHVK